MTEEQIGRLLAERFPDRRLECFASKDNLGWVFVCYDFDWKEVVGHSSRHFKFGKSLGRFVKRACPPDRRAVLYLTNKDEYPHTLQTDDLFIAIVPCRNYRDTASPDPASSFFAVAAALKGINVLGLEPSALGEGELEVLIEKVWGDPKTRSQILEVIERLGGLPVGSEEPDEAATFDLAAFIGLLKVASSAKDSFPGLVEGISADDETPGLADLCEAISLGQRRNALRKFKANLEKAGTSDKLTERRWEEFFRQHPWLLGLNLAECVFLTEVQAQPDLGNRGLDGKGGQRGDALMATSGDLGYTVLVELKTPEARLVEPGLYRNAVHVPAEDVVGGVAQVQSACFGFESGSSNYDKVRDLRETGTYTVRPPGIVVVGRLSSIEANREMAICFGLFRAGLVGVKVVTYDELYDRAKALLQVTD